MYSGGSGLSIDIHFVDIELSYNVLSPLPTCTLLSKHFNHPHPYIEIAVAISDSIDSQTKMDATCSAAVAGSSGKPLQLVSRNFCIGIEGFCCCEDCGKEYDEAKDFRQPKKRLKTGKENGDTAQNSKPSLSLQRKSKANDVRFKEVVSSTELEELSEGFTPKNTAKNTTWAVHVFQEWQNARAAQGHSIPDVYKSFIVQIPVADGKYTRLALDKLPRLRLGTFI